LLQALAPVGGDAGGFPTDKKGAVIGKTIVRIAPMVMLHFRPDLVPLRLMSTFSCWLMVPFILGHYPRAGETEARDKHV